MDYQIALDVLHELHEQVLESKIEEAELQGELSFNFALSVVQFYIKGLELQLSSDLMQEEGAKIHALKHEGLKQLLKKENFENEKKEK